MRALFFKTIPYLELCVNNEYGLIILQYKYTGVKFLTREYPYQELVALFTCFPTLVEDSSIQRCPLDCSLPENCP